MGERRLPSMKDTDRQVVVQLQNAEGSFLGPQLHLPLSTTKAQLQELLNQLQDAEEVTPYSFKLRGPKQAVVEVTSDISEALAELKGVTSETCLSVVYFPLATFRVRPVTRCTASIEAHSEAVLCLAFSPDSSHLASGSGDTTVRIWDLDTETPLKTFTGHTNWVLTVEWCPLGRRLASAGMDKVIKVWNIFDLTAERFNSVTLKGHTKGITCLAWEPAHLLKENQLAPRLASASLDSVIRIWDVVRGVSLLSLSSHTLPVTQIRFSGSEARPSLYSCSRDTTIKLWDTTTGALRQTLKGHGHWVNTLALNTELVMFSGGFDPTTEVSPRSMTVPELVALAKDRYTKYLKTSCGGEERLVTGSDDCTAFLWEPLVSEKPVSRLQGHQRPIAYAQFSPDGRWIATASFDKSIRIWDALSGRYVGVLRGHVGPVYRVFWAPDGRSLVSGSADSTVKVWDVPSKKLKEDLPGHADEVYGIAWSYDGCRVASGSKDRFLKIWRH